jgi:hypothetical protein
MKLLYVVTHPFSATRSWHPHEPRIFEPNESVWWDEEQVCDPVVFHADLVQFEAKRAELSKSIEPFAVR